MRLICLITNNVSEGGDHSERGVEEKKRIHDDVALVLASQKQLDKPRGRKGRPHDTENPKNQTQYVSARQTNREALLCAQEDGIESEQNKRDDGVAEDARHEGERDLRRRLLI